MTSRLRELVKLLLRGGKVATAPLSYAQDGLYVQHHAPFMSDERFLKAYALGKSTGSWGAANIQWRAHVACWAADQVKALPGDFIEFGVNKGGLAQTIIDYLKFDELGKNYYLLDTYKGLDDTLINDAERSVGRDQITYYPDCYQEVVARFGRYPFAKIIRGSVPSTLGQVSASKLCFVSMDMNCAAPEIAALEFCWPKLVPGGVIVLDDYGFRTHETQQYVHRDFARQRHVPLLELPTGQGLIMKPM